MANREQLEILKQGTEFWNKWRKEHPNISIDLESSDLSNMNLDGINLCNALLSGANLSRTSMKSAHLIRATLRNSNLSNSQLDYANLTHIDLTKANLAFSSLEEALLPYARLRKANLNAANLTGAHAEDANFFAADLSYACLKNAVLSFSDFRRASFVGADLEGANISSVNLENANVSLVSYDHGIFFKTLKDTRCRLPALWRKKSDLILDTTMRCEGNHAAACFGSQRFRLFLQDQDYLEEMMATTWGRFWCFLWWLSADCGRSLMRWASWSVIIAMLFSVVYLIMGPRHFDMAHLKFGFPAVLYYSIVTFTTLGFGDISPKTTCAAFAVSLEVILGYIMLGGLISIFSGKLSRRSG